MNIQANAPIGKFIDNLRELLISLNKPTRIIDRIEELRRLSDNEEEIEELRAALEETDEAREALHRTLALLLKVLPDASPDNPELDRCLKQARGLLEECED